VALSADNGATWPRVLDVERGEPGDEFSYPAIVSFGDTLALSYTWKRKRIALWLGTANDIPESSTALESR
jgi:predicted neuraminidase